MENVVFTQLTISEIRQLFRQEIEKYFETKSISEKQIVEYKEQLLTVQEAAQFLNLTVPTIYSKVSKGELPFMKRSKRLYFSSIELIDYLKEGRKMSNADIQAEADAYLAKKKGGEHE